MIKISYANSGGTKMMINDPRPIEEAVKDGRKYIVWDKYWNEWFIAVGSEEDEWCIWENGEPLVSVTHFVEYFPDPMEK